MSGLGSIFGGSTSGDDSESSNSQDSGSEGNVLGTIDSSLGLDASSSHDSSETDEDGNSSTDSSEQDLSLDSSTDGLLHSMGDSFSSSDSDESNS